MKQTIDSSRCSNLVRLLMPTLPAAEASVDELIQLIQSTIRAEHQVAAIRAEAIAEQRRRQGIEHPESVL